MHNLEISSALFWLNETGKYGQVEIVELIGYFAKLKSSNAAALFIVCNCSSVARWFEVFCLKLN